MRVQSARDDVEVRWLDPLRYGVLKTEVHRLQFGCDTANGEEMASRFRPEIVRRLDVIGIGAQVRGTAMAARKEFEHPRAATADILGLSEQLPDGSAIALIVDQRAVGIRACPQARKTPKERMNTARQQSGQTLALPGHATQRH